MNAPDLTRRIQYFSSKSVPLATELVAQPHMAAATWVDMVAERDSLRADNARLREALELMVRGWDRVKRNQPKAILRLREWARDEDTDLMQGIADARSALNLNAHKGE